MTYFPFRLVICSGFLISLTVFAQPFANTNSAHPEKPRYRPGCAPTAAYQEEMVRIMIDEANRFARQMNLPENLPITRTNVRAFVWPPSWHIQRGQIGSIDTSNFCYRVDAGKGVASVDRLPFLREWNEIEAKYRWPVSRLDTNIAFHEALQILKRANIDVDSLNRDAESIDIRASMIEGTNGRYFVPVYWVRWEKDNMNDRSNDDSEGREIAFLVFLEPTQAIQQLDIYRPKYIHRRALESPDLVALLTTDSVDNPREAVLREIAAGTNAAIRRQILLEQHVPESLLRKWGLGPTNAPLAVTLTAVNRPSVTNPPPETNTATAADVIAADTCIKHLFDIYNAKQQWARDYEKDSNSIPTWNDLAPYMHWDTPQGFTPPRCPSGGAYTIGCVADRPACSIPKHDMDHPPALVGCGGADFERRIAGATVVIIDDAGKRKTAVTDSDGLARISTWPRKPVAVVISKAGYLTFSNSYPIPRSAMDAGWVNLQKPN